MDQQTTTEKTYVCLGSCQAVVSEQEYKNGLTTCGATACSMHGQPLVEGKKSAVTNKNEASADQEEE